MKVGTLVRWRDHSGWDGQGRGIIVGVRRPHQHVGSDEAESDEYKIHWFDGASSYWYDYEDFSDSIEVMQ